jgi:hypothetical protein
MHSSFENYLLSRVSESNLPPQDNNTAHYFSRRFDVPDEVFLKDSHAEAEKLGINLKNIKCEFIHKSLILK